MRKWIFILALFVAACSKNEHSPDQPYVPSTDAIGFASEDNWEAAVTKGSIIGSEGFKDNDAIGVFAFFLDNGEWVPENEAPDFMYNQAVIYDATTEKWDYTPAKYWSNDPADRIKFFGYYPHSPKSGDSGITLSANDAKGHPTITFTPHTDVDKQVDFLTATTALLQRPLTTVGFVALQFDHQLTQVIFSAKVNGPKEQITNVQVTEITFKGAKYCGGKYTDTGFEWDINTAVGGSENTTYSIKNREPLSEDTKQLETGLILKTADYTELVTEVGTMLLIPQKIADKQVVITINYNVTTIDGETTTHSQTIEAPSHEFLKGRRMVYQFTIDLMDEYYIELDAVSDEKWNDKELILNVDDMYFNLTGNARAYNWVDHTTDTERLTIGIDFATNLLENNISLKSELADGKATIDWTNSQILYNRDYSDVQVEDRITVTLKFGNVTRTLTIDIVIKKMAIEFTVTVEPWNNNGELEVETQVIKFTTTVEPWNDKGEVEVE